MQEIFLELKNITKLFGGVVALNNVNLKLHKNEVLALVGDNGAGKSTLIKIISGAIKPTTGDIFFEGEKVNIRNPKDAQELGIITIHQHLALVDNLDVSSNVFLGREIKKASFFGLTNFRDDKSMINKTKILLKKLNIDIPVNKINKPVFLLSGGQKQATAIARSIQFKAKLVIMDEPTASLGVEETQKVLELIKKFKKMGCTLIIISHEIEEVFNVTDRIVVLKGGIKVGERITSEATDREILKLIIFGKYNGKG